MAALSKELKRYIVRANAMFDSPAEVVRLVADEFGVAVSRTQVQRFDPTRVGGRTLSTELRELFDRTRHAFVEEIEAVPVAHRAVRLRRLDQIYTQAQAGGLHKIALNALRAIHQEMAVFEFIREPGEDSDEHDVVDVRFSGGTVRLGSSPSKLPMLADPFEEIPEGDLVDPLGLSPTSINTEGESYANPKTPVEISGL
jgi:hypothetical protein